MTRHPRFRTVARLSVSAQIHEMERRHPLLRLASWHSGEACWTGLICPTDVSAMYTVTIRYRLGRRPSVFVTTPELASRPDAEIPHLHGDGGLCLHLPAEWNSTMSIAETIVPWTALWLYHYEVWQATGEWLGGGAHPRLRPGVARRIAERTRRRERITTGAA